jgi:hypothetical protein
MINLQSIDKLHQLERLTIFSDDEKIVNVQDLGNLKNLKWLNLLVYEDQQTFDELLPSLQNLECLELYPEEDSLSLAVLKDLPKLKYLEISESKIDRNTLLSLTNLELLSIPEKTYKDSLYLAELQEALPNTTIIPNAGLCMGSGWLLLTIPALFILLVIKLEWRKIRSNFRNNA